MPGNEALLQTYVYYIQEENMVKEMIFARHLMTDRKGESIFKVVDNFFQEKETLMHNIIRVPPMEPLLWLANIVALFYV